MVKTGSAGFGFESRGVHFHESAGRVKSTNTRPGNPYLKGALGTAAMSAARSKNTYFSAKYRRIASRRGPLKAVVALEHAMLVAIWHMLTDGTLHSDPGDDFFTDATPTDHACAQSSSSSGWATG
jgi:hypothetical protein